MGNDAAPNGNFAEAASEAQAQAQAHAGSLSAPQADLQQIPPVDAAPEPTDKMDGGKSARVAMIDFAMLTRYGYLNVVAERNGV